MGAGASLDDLYRSLGHSFAQPQLLERALTHSSMLASAAAGERSYERLEFLGDRVLGLIAADMLLEAFPDENEGQLARRHVALVRQEALERVAGTIGLGTYLRLGRSEEESGGRANPAILADACEAVIGAIYLDGGLAAAQNFVRAAWRELLRETLVPPKDAKTTLQEWAQGSGLPLPDYREISREGPAHAPIFTVEVSLPGKRSARANAGSKRAAEQAAAAELLDKLNHE